MKTMKEKIISAMRTAIAVCFLWVACAIIGIAFAALVIVSL